jgi:hypothetical protein
VDRDTRNKVTDEGDSVVKRFLLLLGALAICAGALPAQSGFEARWKGLAFLVGNWTGAGGGQPGQGSGKFSFRPDLNGQIMVRKNSNALDNGQKHEDLLVVYGDGPDSALRGMYFDSEGHVIRYRVTVPEPGRAVFESEGEGPRYRLSYWLEGKVLKGKFEVGDRTYLEWGATKDAT